ncbi:MAG TPA: cell wall hydrolase [Bacillus sp. (in: firmicutes)]|nr:cell wall hydrolase [Bacillus sp. (in: firmicutes)]
MKKTYMKTFIAAFAAAFAFIGLQNSSAEARIEYQENSLLKLSQLSAALDHIKKENKLANDWAYIEAMSPIPDKANVLAVKLSKPALKIPHKKALAATQSLKSLKPVMALSPKTVVLAPQSPKPVIVTPPQTKVLGVQASKPVKETPKKAMEPAVSISAAEKDLFARLVEAEAKGESYEGKLAVATVVLNRVDSPEFPDTVTGVINQVVGDSYAFSPVQNGAINKPASDEAKRAVEEALTRKDRLNDCIYFYNPEIATDDWIRSREVVKTIGNHVFAK